MQSLSAKFNFSEEAFLRYDEIIHNLSAREKLIQDLAKDIVTIQKLEQVFHVNDIYLEDETTMTEVVDVLKDLEIKANELWKNEKVKLLQGILARVKSVKREIEQLIAEQETLQPIIDSNNELKEKSKQVALEQAKLSDIENFSTQKKQHDVFILRLINEVAQEYACGLKMVSEQYAEYINRNTSTISSDLTFEVQVRMKNKDFIEQWQEIYGVKAKNANTFIEKWLKDDADNKKVNYEKDLIIEIINKSLDGSIVPLKNKTPQEALANILSNWFTIKYVVKMENDTIDLMSPGKKALVLLKLLIELAESTYPILIDQPEDDLDNRSVYDLLIEFIRTKKANRQIIVVTHNANIVLGADADEVVVANQDGVDSENKARRFEYRSGSIENDCPLYTPDGSTVRGVLNKRGIQQHICDILEGGITAFEKRKNKYHI